jgi:general transcription factor 3C polypeptide 3 (transcription factor C subunit 4)
VEQCRKLINQHQFNKEPLRILTASLASGLRNTDAFITSTLQKHLFREMKLSDVAVKNPGNLRWNPLNKRYALKGGSTKDMDEVDGEVDGDGEGNEDDGDAVDASNTEPSTQTTTPPLPTKEDPMIVTIYGQICIAAKSYQSAICEVLSFGNLAH